MAETKRIIPNTWEHMMKGGLMMQHGRGGWLAGNLAAGILVLSALGAVAQTEPERRILDTQEYDLGERSVILHRVERPVLKEAEPLLEEASAPMLRPALSAELQARQDRLSRKVVFSPYLEIRVMDNGVSELRWRDEAGECVVWTTMDARFMWAERWIETDTHIYMLFGSVAEERVAEIESWNAQIDRFGGSIELKKTIPVLGPVSRGYSRYMVVKEPKPGHVEPAMDALHEYYDAHATRLVRRADEVKAARLAREAYLREHPPEPEDTVIEYFPIRSRASLGSAR